MPAGLVSGEASSWISDGRLLRVLLWPFLCDMQEERERSCLSLVSPLTRTSVLTRVPPLRSNSTLGTSLKILSPNTVTLWSGLQHVNSTWKCGGDTI